VVDLERMKADAMIAVDVLNDLCRIVDVQDMHWNKREIHVVVSPAVFQDIYLQSGKSLQEVYCPEADLFVVQVLLCHSLVLETEAHAYDDFAITGSVSE